MAAFRKHALWGGVPYAVLLAGGAVLRRLGKDILGFSDWRVILPTGLGQTLACLGLAFAASLFPDTDIKSKSQRWLYRGLFLINLGLILRMRYEWSAMLGLVAMVPLLGKHRGWTHSCLTMLLLPLPLLLYPMYRAHQIAHLAGLPYYLAAVVGYATHLYLDGVLQGRS